MTGYSDVELDGIQHRWQVRFPPDLIACLRRQRCEAGNPVFSVYQSDVTTALIGRIGCAGTSAAGWDAVLWPPIKRIRFWSDAEERNE
ncbi:MAG TPA: hypothetical protein VJV39_27160 [Dongiaceae bacterium]|nr:hypothetical protein [Dongiaceae bacterium]